MCTPCMLHETYRFGNSSEDFSSNSENCETCKNCTECHESMACFVEQTSFINMLNDIEFSYQQNNRIRLEKNGTYGFTLKCSNRENKATICCKG